MKSVDLGICQDNIDPQGVGRIRYKIYSDNVGSKEKSIDYKKWDDRDPFVAMPFLPTNMNFIPEIGQAVKIIYYDNDKSTVNQEYIAGPFTTTFDFHSQTYSQQVENTTYGIAVKHGEDVVTSDGKYRNPKSKGAFAKDRDFAIYGKYGSDMILTESGVMLRGGKLISKEVASTTNRKKMMYQPIMSPKSSNFYLKKFPRKMTLSEINVETVKVENTLLKTIVEYTVNSLTNPTTVSIYVYRVNKPYGDLYMTNNFTSHTELNLKFLTLINTDNTTTTPTFTRSVSSFDDVYKEIRYVLYTIHENGLSELDPLYTSDDLHPLYYRPTNQLLVTVPSNETEKSNLQKLFSEIKLRNVGPTDGLVWSIIQTKPKQTKTVEKNVVAKIDDNSGEQTFGAIVTDKMFILSTDTNNTDKTINFDDLNKYEYTQEDYIKKIEPNTYSTVRGENMLELISAMIDVLLSHVHNINKPYVKDGFPQHRKLMELYEKMQNDVLNRSIRIN